VRDFFWRMITSPQIFDAQTCVEVSLKAVVRLRSRAWANACAPESSPGCDRSWRAASRSLFLAPPLRPSRSRRQTPALHYPAMAMRKSDSGGRHGAAPVRGRSLLARRLQRDLRLQRPIELASVFFIAIRCIHQTKRTVANLNAGHNFDHHFKREWMPSMRPRRTSFGQASAPKTLIQSDPPDRVRRRFMGSVNTEAPAMKVVTASPRASVDGLVHRGLKPE
jgi:hypothetical protein